MRDRALPEELQARLEVHFPDLDLARVRIVLGLPWYVRWLAPVRAAAFTASCRTIYCRAEQYEPEGAAGVELLAHELAHCAQFRRFGWWGMALRYLGQYAQGVVRGLFGGHGARASLQAAYWEMPLEAEARTRAAQVIQGLHTETELT